MNLPQNLIWQSVDWPKLTAADPAIAMAMLEARQSHGEVVGKLSAIGLQLSEAMVQDVFVQDVLATSAIEGEVLNPESVRSSVLRGLGLSDAGHVTPSRRYVDGLVDVIKDATDHCDAALDHDRLCRWHAALFPGGTSGIRRILVGHYREHADEMQIVSGKIGREVIHYTAPPSEQVKSEMDDFLHWFEASKGSCQDGISRAAIAHLWFESIHPFEDGNGRLGRTVMDMALMQGLGPTARIYSMSNQMMINRSAYYDALNLAQRGTTDVSAWVMWFATTFTSACRYAAQLIDQAIKKGQFWHEHAQKDINPRQRKILQRLLDDGDAGFIGGLNVEKYAKMTSASKATATRDLTQLVANQMLFSKGQGKALRYYINVQGWQHGL